MLYQLMLLAENVPQTGDNFPARKLLIVGGAAAAIAVVSIVLSLKKGGKDDE